MPNDQQSPPPHSRLVGELQNQASHISLPPCRCSDSTSGLTPTWGHHRSIPGGVLAEIQAPGHMTHPHPSLTGLESDQQHHLFRAEPAIFPNAMRGALAPK